MDKTNSTNCNMPLIQNIEDSRFIQKWKRRCTNMNHEDEDNHRMDTFLVLEFNDELNRFLDINPEYWCHDCVMEDCDI